jgi:valyl-tRNA synthetase
MALVTDIVRAVRNIRSKLNVGERKAVEVLLTGADEAGLEAVKRHEHFIRELAQVSELTVGPELVKPEGSATEVVGSFEIYVPLSGLIDFEEERKRLEARLAKTRQGAEVIEKKLSNPNFINKAPEPVVNRERKRQRAILEEIEKLTANIRDLSG